MRVGGEDRWENGVERSERAMPFTKSDDAPSLGEHVPLKI